jgi:hypothetical protein
MMDNSEADSCYGDCLFGVCTEGFKSCSDPMGMGVGNDACSWGVCGMRQEKTHDDAELAFGSKWKNGDVIGFAVDMRAAGDAVMRVSVNGSFTLPNGVAFSAIKAPYLTPAFSAASGFYRVNFGLCPFAHAPPDDRAGYVSVWHFAQSECLSGPGENPEGAVGLFLYRGAGFSAQRLYKGLLASQGTEDPRMCPFTMKFDGFNTYVANVKLRRGCFYYEVEVVDGTHVGSLWSLQREQFTKPEGTVSLLFDWGVCAQLISGDYAVSTELCNGRPIYYKRAGANMIIRHVYSTAGVGMWAVQLVKPSGDAWTAAELQGDVDIADCEGSCSKWRVFDGKRVSAVTSPAMSLRVRVWRRPVPKQQAQTAATSSENECLHPPAKLQACARVGVMPQVTHLC